MYVHNLLTSNFFEQKWGNHDKEISKRRDSPGSFGSP